MMSVLNRVGLAELQSLSEAQELDVRLRFLANARSRVQRLLGQGLERFCEADGLTHLCCSTFKDYCREHLGVGLRDAQELRRFARVLKQYPETLRLWEENRINRCHVRDIVAYVP